MSWPDAVNGAFEFVGGAAQVLNVRRILIDKQVRGYSIFALVFFTCWGYWNLYYYPSLAQWFSFVGGIFIVAGNTLWVALTAYYLRWPGGRAIWDKDAKV